MSGFINKIKEQAQGYKDQETGKTGYSGVMAEGKEAWANYQKDKNDGDGKINWAQQGKDLFGDVKAGLGGGKKPAAGAPAPAQPPAQPPQ